MVIYDILLADDDENDVLLVKIAFARAGLAKRIIVVDDGEKVLQYLKGEAPYSDRAFYPLPQLLLLDLSLPRLSGLEVLAWLQTWPGSKQMPAIALSGSCDNAILKRAHDLGAFSFLQKRAEISELALALKELDGFFLASGNLPPARRSLSSY
jgi:CheY-like chemotaxis protein